MDSSSAPATTPAAGRGRPGWLAPLSLLLSVAGLLVSIYMTYQHYTGNKTLACSVSGLVDCERVTTSQWSTLFGIPMAVFGLVFFVVAIVLCLPSVWRRTDALTDRLRLGWMSVGLLMVLYLVWVEFFRIGAICSWCTVVHVLTFLVWAVVLFGQILSDPAESDPAR